jgi:hypothetical protein
MKAIGVTQQPEMLAIVSPHIHFTFSDRTHPIVMTTTYSC